MFTEILIKINRFEVLIESVLLENKEIIILGDFNKDLLNLNINNAWSNFITSFGLRQLITEPTRATNTTKTLIDHVYVSNEENVSSACVKKLGISDHYSIACNRKINFSLGKNSHKEIQYRAFKTFDENAFLCEFSSASWHQIEAFDNIDDILAAWYSLFIAVIDKHAPIRTRRIKHDTQADWLTSEILDKIKER